MNEKNQLFLIRWIGGTLSSVLIMLSSYHQHMSAFVVLLVVYLCGVTFLHFIHIPARYEEKVMAYHLFADVVVISIAIGIRGGLRSDFYIGYVLILGYVLLQGSNKLLPISIWISACYGLVSYYFNESQVYSWHRLIIRLSLIMGITYVLNNYQKRITRMRMEKKEARILAMTDSLTGLSNRHQLDLIDTYGAIALIDIDDFKSINDTYGHGCGDDVLVYLSTVFLRHLKDKDQAIRYGGEEFLIVFETDQLGSIQRQLKAMQNDFNHPHFDWLEPQDGLHFTAGIVLCPKGHMTRQCIQCADEALYYGKQNGKNRLVVYGQEENGGR